MFSRKVNHGARIGLGKRMRTRSGLIELVRNRTR